MISYSECKAELDKIKKIRPGENLILTFCGVFSSGKSSILNGLLCCEQYRLPTGIQPVTKLVTELRYGESLCFYFEKNGERQHIGKDRFDEIVTGLAELPEGVSRIVAEIPSELLAKGIIVLDTPGFNDEMGGALEQMSREAVMEADVVFFCTNAIQLGNMFEKEYINELQQSHGNFITVVTHMDILNTEQDEETVIEVGERLMKGKGGKMIKSIVGTNLFFVVSDGKYRNLNGLDRAIVALVESEEKLDGLKYEVSINKKLQKYDDLLEKIVTGIAMTTEQTEELRLFNESEKEKLQIKKYAEQQEKAEDSRELADVFCKKIDDCLEKTYIYIDKQSEISDWSTILRKSGLYMRRQFVKITQEMDDAFVYDDFSKKLFTLFYKKIGDFRIIIPDRDREKALMKKGPSPEKTLTFGVFGYKSSKLTKGELYAWHIKDSYKSRLRPSLKKTVRLLAEHKLKASDAIVIETEYEKELHRLEKELERLRSLERGMRIVCYARLSCCLRNYFAD